VGAGETADWYDAPTGGTPILADATSYTPTMAGTYYAETRDLTNGCLSETRTPVTLTINALPELVVANATDPGCGINNGSITLEPVGGQAPYLYQIDGQGFVFANVFDDLAAATYSFTIQDDNGCQGTLDTTLVAPMGVTAVATVTDTLTCAVTSVVVDGNTTTSDGMVTYEWTFNGETISSIITAEAMEPGNYILTAFQDACTSSDTIEVAQNLSPDLLAVLNTENQLDCNVTSALLDGTGSDSGPEISYEWFMDGGQIIGADQITYMADMEGTYILFVTDDHTGCVVSDTLVLVNNENYPVANAGQDGTITCAVTSIFADGSGSQSGDEIVYQWFDPSGTAINGATQDTLTIFAPGTYSLMVQDTTNGCSNTDEMSVSTDLLPPVANAGEQMQLDCNETTLNLNGQGSSVGTQYGYAWTTDDPGTGSILSGAQTLTPLIGGPGNYYLLVTNNDNGCTSTDATFVTQVTTIPTDFSVVSEDAGCYGESNGYITIAAQDPGLQILYAFNDQPFSSTTQYSSLTAGSYSITAEDASGCQWDTTVIIQEGIELQLDLGEDLFIHLGDSVHLQPIINFPQDSIASINWSNRDLLACPDCFDPHTYLLTNTSSFQLDLTDVDGCAVSDDITIFVDKSRRVFIPNAFSPNGDGNNDLLVINSGNDVFNVKSFIILNRWGEMVFERFNFPTNQPTYGWDGNFRGKPMNAGVFVYMAEIEYVDGEVEIRSGDIILMR
jgi:gliding motility-associated-like protein